MSEDEIPKIIKSTSNKSCNLDPIPTSLVLDCISVLLTHITNNVNYSLQEISFPSCFKTAHVIPLVNCLEAVQAWMGNNKLKLEIVSRRSVSPDGTWLKRGIQSIMSNLTLPKDSGHMISYKLSSHRKPLTILNLYDQ